MKWLMSAGAEQVEDKGDFIKASASVTVAEALFSAPVWEVVEEATNKHHYKILNEYSLPSKLDDVLDFLPDLTQLIKKVRAGYRERLSELVGTVGPSQDIIIP